jgi:hypothetical protein
MPQVLFLLDSTALDPRVSNSKTTAAWVSIPEILVKLVWGDPGR